MEGWRVLCAEDPVSEKQTVSAFCMIDEEQREYVFSVNCILQVFILYTALQECLCIY